MDFKNPLAAGEPDMPGVLSVCGSFSMFRGQNIFFFIICFFFEGKDDLFPAALLHCNKAENGPFIFCLWLPKLFPALFKS